MLFFLFPYIFNLLLLFPHGTKSQSCLGYDSNTNNCRECPLTHYRKKGGLYVDDTLNIDNDCTLKLQTDQLYTTNIYVRNISCSDPLKSSNCLGTKDHPFDSLIKAMIKIHNSDMAEKYIEQKINIYLLGNPHYILPSDLLYNDMRFFRRMNATITIGPLFCEDELFVGCIFGYRADKIDLYLKTDAFIFEIYRNLIIYNLNIIANDIILTDSASSLTCYNEKSICCNEEYFLTNLNKCGIQNYSISMNEVSKMIKLKGFIILKSFIDDTTNSLIIPTVNLTNFFVRNLYSIKSESSWISIILFNNLFYNIILNNVYFLNNLLPYGYIYQINLEEDPYYNFLSFDQIKQYYSFFALYTSYTKKINIDKIKLEGYNPYNIQPSVSTAGKFSLGLITISDEINYNTLISIQNIDIFSIKLNFGIYFLVGFYSGTVGTVENYLPKIYFKNIFFKNSILFGLMYVQYFSIFVEDFNIDSISSINFPVFNLRAGCLVNFYKGIIGNGLYTTLTNLYFNVISSIITYNSTIINNLTNNIGYYQKSTVNFLNCTFSNVLVIDINYFIDVSESNLNFYKFVFINSTVQKLTGCFIHLFASIEIILSLKNSYFEGLTSYRFFQLESYKLLPIVNFTDTKITNCQGFWNGRFFYNFFIDCNVGSLNIMEMNNLDIINNKNFLIVYILGYFQSLKLTNLNFINISGISYYLFLVYPISGDSVRQNNVTFTNVTIKNIEYARFIDMSYMGIYGNLTFTNVTFTNLSTIYSVVDLKGRNQLFYLQDIKRIVMENISFDFTNNTYYLSFATLYFCEIVSIKNSIFRSLVPLSLKRIQVLSARSFVTFDFYYNKLLNMSTSQSPMDIGDETGILAFLASSGYFLSILQTTVNFFGNYIEGSYGVKYGVIGFIGVTISNIKNNTFVDVEAYYGGSIAFYAVQEVYIDDLLIKGSKGMEGGGINVYDVLTIFQIKNSRFYNVKSQSDGGLFFLNKINEIKCFNLTVSIIESSSKAGVFMLIGIIYSTFQDLDISNTLAQTGGVFYIQDSTVKILKSQFSYGIASQSGGFAYFLGSMTDVLLIDTYFHNFYCDGDGGILSSLNIDNLTVDNCVFSSSSVRAGGNGIINLQGFYIAGPNDNKAIGVFVFKNIVCNDNIAVLGACFYYSSNNQFEITNMLANNNTGSLFNVESDNSQTIVLTNVTILNTNIFIWRDHYNKLDADSPVIVFINVNIDFFYMNASFNAGKTIFFKFSAASIRLMDSSITNYIDMNGDAGNARFLYVSESNFISENNVFSYTDLIDKKEHCMFIEVKSSSYESRNDSYINSQSNDIASFSVEESDLEIYDSLFQQLQGNMGALTVKMSDIYIENCTFSNNTNTLQTLEDDQSSDIYFSGDESNYHSIKIFDSKFNIKDRNSIYIKFSNEFLSGNNIFNSLLPLNKGSFTRGLYLSYTNFTNISDCIFSNFFSPQGSAISGYKPDDELPTMDLHIRNCKFLNNTGEIAGAIYIVGSINLGIKFSKFENNKAIKANIYNAKIEVSDTGKAGCILLNSEYYYNCFINIENTFFNNNIADNLAPTILIKSLQKITEKSNTFFNNSDSLNFTNRFSSFPIHVYLLSNDFNMEIYNNMSNITDNSLKIAEILKNYQISDAIVASGQEFNFTVIITDDYNQLLYPESKTSGELSCLNSNKTLENQSNSSSFQNVFIDKGATQAYEGILSFEGVRIIYFPDTNLSCKLTVNYPDSVLIKSDVQFTRTLNRSIAVPFNIFLRKCIKGEILMEDHTCFQCLAGTYLLNDPMTDNALKKCISCPDNAYCKGGDYISPWKGYWRANENSSLILQCFTEESCLGVGENLLIIMDFNKLSKLEAINGVCHENYWGNFCYQCIKGYGRFKTNAICEPCSSLVVIYVKMILSIIFIVAYVFFQAKIFSSIEHKDPQLAVLMKLLLNHFQTISMISLVDLGWTVDFQFYFSLQDYLSFLSQDFFVIDCIIQNIKEDLLVQKIIFTTLLPIILSLIMISFWLVSFTYILYTKRTNTEKLLIFLTEKMRITFLILIFILYPEILRKSFSLINCILIDDSNDMTVLSLSPNVECWSADHTMWVLTVSMPGLLVWGVLTPLIIFIILFKYKSRIKAVINESNFIGLLKNTMTNRKKKGNLIHKRICVDIEPKLAEILFPENQTPQKSEIKYKKNNRVFIETVEVFIKSREKIKSDMKKNEKPSLEKPNLEPNPPRISIIDKEQNINQIIPMNILKKESMAEEDLVNSDLIITDAALLLHHLAHENLKDDIITDEDLKKYLVRVKEEFEEIESEELLNAKKDVAPINEEDNPSNKVKKIPTKTLLVIKNLGFIYRGYKPEVYYWEIIMFTRKFMLIFIGVFTEFFPKKTKPTMLIIILVGYMYLQIKFRPYQFTYLNSLETSSLIIAFLTGNIGILLFSDYLQNFSIFFVLVIFFINALYFGYWFKCLLLYGKVKETITEFKKNLRMLKARICRFFCF